MKNLSTGIEARATGEPLNSGDPAVDPAARHSTYVSVQRRSIYRVLIGEFAMYRARGFVFGNPVLYENELKPREKNESIEGVVVR